MYDASSDARNATAFATSHGVPMRPIGTCRSRAVRAATTDIHRHIKVAVMGCIVNGPGEAREADLGVCGGRDGGALIVKGQPPRAIRGDLAKILIEEVRRYAQEN